MANLRKRQQDILEFIAGFIDGHGYPPSVRDIQEGCSISSTSVVDYNLEALSKMGYLKRSKEISRGIELVGHRSNKTRIPLLGSVSAGQPLPVFPEDHRFLEDNSIEVDPSFIEEQSPVFALHVKGDSMIDALIKDGDYVVIKKIQIAKPGDTVVALINGEATLKRYYIGSNGIELHPRNNNYSIIHINQYDDLHIQGLVLGVIRKYN